LALDDEADVDPEAVDAVDADADDVAPVVGVVLDRLSGAGALPSMKWK